MEKHNRYYSVGFAVGLEDTNWYGKQNFMKLDYTDFLYALSYALDAAEKEVTGASSGHGKRVAWLSMTMAKDLHLSDDALSDLMGCAILHDNAIAEYIREELEIASDIGHAAHEDVRTQFGEKSVHAAIGEEKISLLPFRTDIKNVILYHHENADGSGPFGKKEGEVPLFAEIIHLADLVDLFCDLESISEAEFYELKDKVMQSAGKVNGHKVVSMFVKQVSYDAVLQMQQAGALKLLQDSVPVIVHDYSDLEMMGIARFFMDIVDYKSSFTKDHSIGVAQKAQQMAEFYGFDHEKAVRFTFAGAMHDIGKMVVGNDILEKPDKLNDQEFGAMKNHAAETYRILSSIKGLEDITEWAANHHEKLDGTGYSRRMKAEQQTKEDRIMACLDIYQALTEPRPYKDGLSHGRSMAILRDMASQGKIDASIVEDIHTVFGRDAVEEDESQEVKLTTKQWKCPVCGYVYEGDTPPAACPVCDTDADQFSLMD